MAKTDIVICGAGIAGIATAYYLSTHFGRKNIVLIDRDQPMSYTTSKSGENFRDYWPQACMAAFATRSIELMEAVARESRQTIELRSFGYDFVSMHEQREIFPSRHLRDNSRGSQLAQFTGSEEIKSRFPYLADAVRQVVHIGRAGAVDVHALGSYMVTRARKAGVMLKTANISGISRLKQDFRLETDQGETLEASELVLAGGPMNRKLAAMLGVELQVESYLQRKFVMPDPLAVIPRDMPFTIFADPQHLDWSDEERTLIADDPDYHWLLDEFPAGLHIKPESAQQIKLGWAYNREPEEPCWQPSDDFDFPNIALRGASRFIPGLGAYVEQAPTPIVQFSGYYTRTAENWPIIGPLDEHPGLYTVAALSGFGTMTACAAGELAALCMMGETLPDYARNFRPDRYGDLEIMAEIQAIESDGQL